MPKRKQAPLSFEIDAVSNGRIRKGTVTVLDDTGKVVTTDKGDLQSEDERRKLAVRLAKKLKRKAQDVQQKLEDKWNETLGRHRRQCAQAEAGSAEAAPDVRVELLDSSPAAIRRPLCLIGGRAYAAAWVPIQRTVRQTVDQPAGESPEQEMPPTVVEKSAIEDDALLIVRDDGQLYTDAKGLSGARSLAELRLRVQLPFIPPPGRRWRGSSVRDFLGGDRPDAADVFRRLISVIDAFLDFNRSLASQETLCELLACYILATWLLDGFNVIGYLWPNGERGCGKTMFLHVVAELAYLGELLLSGSSYACLRDLADYGATLAFDDAENVMDAKRVDPDKRTLLLAGNRKGATVAVKEQIDDRWVTRHVNTFCPRAFSAIRLPDEVLGSRSIIVPLVRSGDEKRTKASVLDAEQWPCDRRQLLDDLWGLALSSLPELPEYDRQAAALARLSGRLLEPWRAILAVAHWLEQRHGVAGLFTRLEKLSVDYQEERSDFEEGDRTRMLFRVLLALTEGKDPNESCRLMPKDIATYMNELATREELVEDDKPFTNPRKVGWLMKRQRFKRGDRNDKSKTWKVTRAEIVSGAKAYGINVEEPLPF